MVKSEVFRKDALVSVTYKAMEARWIEMMDERLDRARYRYERRYGRPLPSMADILRARDLHRDTREMDQWFDFPQIRGRRR